MEVVSPSLKNLWNEWQLRTLILLSLTLQIVLIVLGNRRKYIRKFWINMLVWPAYLTADFVATTALGVITSNLFEKSGPLDANLELTTFWAPFLLLHLGGPDAITAYAVEDNELWRRHLLQLLVHAGLAFYIFQMSWTGSLHSILAIPMMLVGLIKYGERTWVLWSASEEVRLHAVASTSKPIIAAAEDHDQPASSSSINIPAAAADDHDHQPSSSSTTGDDHNQQISSSSFNIPAAADDHDQRASSSSINIPAAADDYDHQPSSSSATAGDHDQQASSSFINIPAAADGVNSSDSDQQDSTDSKLDTNPVSDDEGNNLLVAAYGLFDKITKRFFRDTAFTTADLEASASILNRISSSSPNNAFRVIGMEIGFMYDMLYTKVMVAHTLCGLALRFATCILTCIVVVLLFSLECDSRKYSKVDLCITLLLLIVAIVLELFALLLLISSNQTTVWLRRHNRSTKISRAIATSLPLFQTRMWSNTIGQFNLLSYCLREKEESKGYCRGLLFCLPKGGRDQFSNLAEEMERRRYEAYRQVPRHLKASIFQYFQKEILSSFKQCRSELQVNLRMTLRFFRGFMSMQRFFVDDGLRYTVLLATEMEYGQTLIFWHIVTEHCYHLDYNLFSKIKKQTPRRVDTDCDILLYKTSKYISRYMMYLLVVSSDILVPGCEKNIRSSCKEIREVLTKLSIPDKRVDKEKRETRIKACKMMFGKFRDTPMSDLLEMGFQGSLLPHACGLLHLFYKGINMEDEVSFGSLQSMKKFGERWKTISSVWMELMATASVQCRGIEHAKQLAHGGELLTHASLLMAHFNYDIGRGRPQHIQSLASTSEVASEE